MNRTFNVTLLGLTLASSLLLSACIVEPVRPARPAPLVEVIPGQPAPGYHWVKGHYRWEANQWVWVRGHWSPD
jgi:hypothetical protein